MKCFLKMSIDMILNQKNETFAQMILELNIYKIWQIILEKLKNCLLEARNCSILILYKPENLDLY